MSFSPLFSRGEGSPTRIDDSKKGTLTLILTSLLENLDVLFYSIWFSNWMFGQVSKWAAAT